MTIEISLGDLADPSSHRAPVDLRNHATEQLVGDLEAMILIRRAEELIGDLSASGEAKCPCHLAIGQEAVAVGVARSLTADDRLYGGHRSHSQFLALGGDPEALIAEVRERLATLDQGGGASALYLRPNGGTAGAQTHVHAVLEAAGLRNHAAAGGRRGWGRAALEEVVADPPEVIVSSRMVHDTAYARAGFSRHPQMRELAATRPLLAYTHNDWGCSNWQLVEAAEELAAGLRQVHAAEALR